VIRAPDPASQVRRTLTPPDDLAVPMPPMICAATAWRRDIRARARRTSLTYAASVALSVLLLSVFVWTHHALPPREATTVAQAVPQ
jgi:hypothetical protein